jgi:DNA-binding transcriptional regulator LsrR (DeoR family)
MARIDELRLMTRVARMYYEQGMRQSDIAGCLSLSQATISRLLKRAEQEQIVRITISVPNGVYPELEEALTARYGLRQAVVADCTRCDDEEEIQRNVGAAAAYYLESTIERGECIGISSWSATLLAMVDAMHPVARATGRRVVQILGGASESPTRSQAVYLTNRLATLVRGEATFLSAPAVVGSEEARKILLNDPYVRGVIALFDKVTLAFVGIGAIEPSPLLASSGNVFSPQELALLRQQGAVGDVLARFFDSQGRPVDTPLNDRVIGMGLDQLKQVKRSVGVAGGRRKLEAVRGALLGGLINVLITDRFTAETLVEHER